MRHMPINDGLAWGEFLVVRMLRRWAACRIEGSDALPSLIDLGADLGAPPPLAMALQSLFHLTEACLGRDLNTACVCDTSLTRDELAVLQLVRVANPARLATRAVPHGLPGVLAWTAATTRLMLQIDSVLSGSGSSACPFASARQENTGSVD